MKIRRLLIPFLGAALPASAGHFDGSRTAPVHRIPLTAEDGQRIVATVPNTMPFSARQTCGACHDYAAIDGGTHFGGAGQGRPGEPWIAVDEKSGTQVPAARLNLSEWDFVKRFGSHLPGGGRFDPADKLADEEARWDISGGLEINCLACHNLSPRQDLTEWAKQIGRENFRWAATAAAGLGEVGGMAARMASWWDVYTGANPDDHAYAVPPSVDYDLAQFDSKHRAWFDLGMPADKNCLQCHSVHPVGRERMEIPGDVHAAAGLSCTDCHRNGIDHRILRGTTEAMDCAACHSDGGLLAGQAGAPVALHKGIPPVHFEELTCTACHSGPAPADAPQAIRTSRANRLGIHGRAQWFTDSPFIVEPVFVRNDDGKIEPRRMMWPAYWAYADGAPLDEDLVAEAAAGVLDAPEQVAAILARLAAVENAPGEPLYATAGRLYRRNVDGGLDLAGSIGESESWLWLTESNLVSITPPFDAAAEQVDYDAEGTILAIMDALKPLDTMVVTQGTGFAKDADGYLAGTNSILSAGWYRRDGQPLVDGMVARAVADTVGQPFALNEEQLALMLAKLGPTTCYIANGRKFTLSEEGVLVDENHPSAEPVSWAFGHDVRGGAQALGAKGCRECHASDTPFLFGTVTATGPLLTGRSRAVAMHTFEGVDRDFNELFGLSFAVRKWFKAALATLALLLALLALAFGLPALHRLAVDLAGRGRTGNRLVAALAAGVAVLAVTGFVFGWPVRGALGGFPLLLHVAFGGLYAVALLAWALLRARTGGLWLWLLVGSGIVLILSVLVAMFPILGTQGQHAAIVLHRMAALATLVAAAGCMAARKER